MENKSHAMAAGLFVVVVACLLAGLALWLTRDKHQYQEYELSTSDAISGLNVQAGVLYKGVSVGKVTAIGFDPKSSGNVLIRIAVDESAPVSPTTTFAQLGYQGVTGIAHVQLDDLEQPLPAPDKEPDGLPRLLMKSSPLTVLADQGMVVLGRVNEATRRINELLGEENQQHFSAALENIAGAAQGVNQLTRTLEHTLTKQVDPAMAQLPALTQEARRSMQALTKVGTDASALVADVRAIAQRLQSAEGALAQLEKGSGALGLAADRLGSNTLPAVGQAASDVSRAARSLGGMTAGITENPQSLIFGDGKAQPGPGEPGFVPPAVAPAP